MIVPKEAKEIGNNKKLNFPLIEGVAIFFIFIAIIAMFCFIVTINLDIEFEDIEESKGGFLIALTVVLSLLVMGICSIVIVYGATRKIRNKYSSILVDSDYLYFKENNDNGISIPLTNIISYDEGCEYLNLYFDLGTKDGLRARFFDSFNGIEVQYKDGNKTKSIKAFVADPYKTKNAISDAVATTKNQSFSDSLRQDGEKMINLSQAYWVVGLVTFLGLFGLFAMFIGFHIEDVVDFDKELSIPTLVIFGILCFSGLPILLMISKTFNIYRHQPHNVIIYNRENETFYLYKDYHYIAVPSSDIIESKKRHSTQREIENTYRYKDFQTNQDVWAHTYKYYKLPEGRITVKYKSGKATKVYWVYVAEVEKTFF